jgi:hypothetical protein
MLQVYLKVDRQDSNRTAASLETCVEF